MTAQDLQLTEDRRQKIGDRRSKTEDQDRRFKREEEGFGGRVGDGWLAFDLLGEYRLVHLTEVHGVRGGVQQMGTSARPGDTPL